MSPERALHPLLQKRFRKTLAEYLQKNDKNSQEGGQTTGSGSQSIIITHSPYMLAIESLESIYRFSKNEKFTEVNVFDTKDEGFIKFLNKTPLVEIYLSSGVFFVEGNSERLFFELFDQFDLNFNLTEANWKIVDMGGVAI